MSRIHAFILSLTSIFCPGCDGTDSSSSSSTGYGTPADSLAARSDWVIDDCRVTYKGKPVPVGSAFPAVVEVFGPPDDSVIGDSTIAGRPRHYFWDRIGVEAFTYVESSPARYLVEVNFREPRFPKGPLTADTRSARGFSSVGIRPHGRLDSLNNRRIIESVFSAQGSLHDGRSYFLQIPFSSDTYLEVHPEYGGNASEGYASLYFYLGAPKTGTYQTYPQIFAALGANCKLPGER